MNKLIKQFEKTKLTMKKLARNRGAQAKLMQQMGAMGMGGSMPNLPKGFNMPGGFKF